MALLGISPDYRIGWGVIDDGQLIDYGIVEQDSEVPVSNRLFKLFNVLDSICSKYPIEALIIKSPKMFPGQGKRINMHEFIIKQVADNKLIAIAECIAGKWMLGIRVYFVDSMEFDGFEKAREFVKEGFNINVNKETAEAIFLALKKEKVWLRVKRKEIYERSGNS